MSQQMGPNFDWTKYSTTHGYVTAYQGPGTDTPHYANDIGTPFHTQITALLGGSVIQADYMPWGGELFIRTSAGQTYYYFHLDLIQVAVGDTVIAGQVVGLSGGQNSGGLHPTIPQYSTGPHTHVGWFTGYVQTQNGTIPYGPDVTPLITAARAGSTASFTGGGTATGAPPAGPGGGATGGESAPAPAGSIAALVAILPGTVASIGPSVQKTLNNVPGFAGIAQALDEAERFPGIVPCGEAANATTGNTDFIIFGIDTGISNPLAQAQQIQSDFGADFCTVFSTITANSTAFIFRFIVVAIGMMLLAALFWKAGSDVAEQVAPLVEMAAA